MARKCSTNEEMIAFKLKVFPYALKYDDTVQLRSKTRRLIEYYENGGPLLPPGESIWLVYGKVVHNIPSLNAFAHIGLIWERAVRHPLPPYRVFTDQFVFLSPRDPHVPPLSALITSTNFFIGSSALRMTVVSYVTALVVVIHPDARQR